MFTVALFDFDGVILDSAPIKTQGFVDCFPAESPEVLEAIREYVARRGGESRFAKFRHIHDSILGRPLTDTRLAELCDLYSSLVFDKVLAAHEVPGARELLGSIHASVDCYVVSGTPENEVRLLVDALGLTGMFKGVAGSPEPKHTLTEGIARRYPARDRIVFIGDAITDYEAARDAGIAFLGVAVSGDRSALPADAEVTSNLMNYRSRFPAATARSGRAS